MGSLQASSENGEAVVRSCRRTLMTLIQNAVENVENKIFEVLEGIGSKMAPVIQRFMVEGTARYLLYDNTWINACLAERNLPFRHFRHGKNVFLGSCDFLLLV